jgi:ribose/xylose/arabinose/galactoside ABC-type transport system permease subunit
MFYLLLAYVVMCVYLSLAAPNFLTGRNLVNILRQMFIISSVLAALAGLILAARLEAGQAAVAQGWELDVIAAVIIRGTSLFGGSGNILGRC